MGGLSGCLDVPAAYINSAQDRTDVHATVTQVGQRALTLRAPRSHCFDAINSQQNGAYSFVIFQPCTLKGANGILTMSIGQTRSQPQDISQMQKFFESDAGRAALSPSRNSNNTQILQTFRQKDILYFKVRDAAGPRIKSTSTTTWRSVFQVAGLVFSGAYLPDERRPLSEAKSLDLVAKFTVSARSAALKSLQPTN